MMLPTNRQAWRQAVRYRLGVWVWTVHVLLIGLVVGVVRAKAVTVPVLVDVEDDVIGGVVMLDGAGLRYKTTVMPTAVRVPWGALIR
jgi:hypothetical protein